MSNQELVVHSGDQWSDLRDQAHFAFRSGYLPGHIKTPEQAVMIAMVGRDIGVSVTRALLGISVIAGKPSLSSELMADMIFRAHGGKALTIVSSTDKECTIAYQRKDGGERKSYTYTMAMAERAGLGGNVNYKKNPEAMLRARCVSAIGRMAFPDAIAGCYVEDEIDNDEVDSIPGTTRIEEYAPPQPNPRNADTATGEIRPAESKKQVADSDPAPAKWLVALQDLSNELHDLDDTMIVAVPKALTIAEARSLKAELEITIAELRRALAENAAPSDDDLAAIGV